MKFICLVSTGLPELLVLLFFAATPAATLSQAPMPAGLLELRGGKSHVGAFCSQARLSKGLEVDPDVGLLNVPSGVPPTCGEETPYSAGLYCLRGRSCAVLLVLVVLAGSSVGEKNAAFGEVE